MTKVRSGRPSSHSASSLYIYLLLSLLFSSFRLSSSLFLFQCWRLQLPPLVPLFFSVSFSFSLSLLRLYLFPLAHLFLHSIFLPLSLSLSNGLYLPLLVPLLIFFVSLFPSFSVSLIFICFSRSSFFPSVFSPLCHSRLSSTCHKKICRLSIVATGELTFYTRPFYISSRSKRRRGGGRVRKVQRWRLKARKILYAVSR